ncbi:MAG: hypothetical protein OEZ57_01440 [Nitrospirota bacterium]|nr:hypothetical protein [Nitrospirota bacterium]MDH5585622.1 hypothetical protein [Nitrospirota bacterium]MDH5773564.1 hypothetical protein [Nitrospirota bacterium]
MRSPAALAPGRGGNIDHPTITSSTCQVTTIQQRGNIMGGLEILGFLAIAIGVIGLIVLLKSRKKSGD